MFRAGMMMINHMPDKVNVGPVHLDIEVSVQPFLRRTGLSKPSVQNSSFVIREIVKEVLKYWVLFIALNISWKFGKRKKFATCI